MTDRTVFYEDPLADDFAGTHIDTVEIGADFPFLPQGILYNALGTLLYYVIAIPLVFLMARFTLGLRTKNRRALGQVRGQAFYLYGNHTQALDAVLPALAAWPQRAYVIAHRDAVSIRGLRTIVQMLGAIPVPSEIGGMRSFSQALEERAKEGACIGIFPEAHIWPWYTGVRPFASGSFRYPARSLRPVVAMAATYRKRRGLFAWRKKPAMTLWFSEPIYPDPALSPRQRQENLRNQVYDFMKEVTSRPGNVSYIQYLPKEAENTREADPQKN